MAHSRALLGSVLILLLSLPAWAGNTYVGATEADTLFSTITAEDMAIIRTKNVLIASRSYGQNMLDGIDRLKAVNPMYALDYGRNIVNLFYVPESNMPADVFSRDHVVHYLCSLDPETKRLDEFDRYLRNAPYQFASKIDVAMVEFHQASPATFPYYKQKMDGWRRDFPNIHFIFVTAGVQPLGPNDDNNEASWQFGDLVEANYRGVAPLMDWRDLLSTHADGTSAGHYMASEFNLNYPSGDSLHPNAPFIEERLGKALLVMLKGETVPEPATGLLLAVGALALRRRRR